MSKFHRRAFLTNFEIACEFAIIALLADLLWLSHDVVQNGFSLCYGLVGTGLTLGILGTSFALIRHHKYYVHRFASKRCRVKYTKGYDI